MRHLALSLLAGAAAAVAIVGSPGAQTASELKSPSAFASISDQTVRSRALFAEAAKVITHPRCMNCHPAGDQPLQGNERPHFPPVPRGEGGAGTASLPCSACHQQRNVELVAGRTTTVKSMPGHPRWQLAPHEMAWQGKSLGDICRQLKDVKRNGGRDLALLHEHFAKDDLVAWGWDPGTGRDPAPGSQAVLGELIQAWIDSGAECP
jgi:hypothetical protein